MDSKLARRDFLKAAPVAVGAIAYSAEHSRPAAAPGVEAPVPETLFKGGEFPIVAKPFNEVVMKDDFWRPKIKTNAEVTIPFEVAKRLEAANPRGFGGGVLEAAIFSLQTHPDPKLQAQVEARIQRMAQDGAANPPMSNREFEIAASWFRATGKRDLLDNAIKSAEKLIAEFKANDPPFSGGERDALNSVQLYRVTGDRRHLELAKHYLDIRGRPDSVGRSRHNQSHEHVTKQTEAVGHAVNCVTLILSMVDVGVLTGERVYFDAAHRMWTDAATTKMYITGGVGSTGNEGFGDPYWLPNISAYSETCAVLMFITLNHRLFLATGDSKYIDVMERGMYNNAIDGVSASGDHFFYVNRLASAGDGRDLRWQRASLECCPPNLVRFMASMPGYMYAQDRDGALYVNLYASSDASFKVNEKDLTLNVQSEMPWGGKSTITVATKEDVKSRIKLRIPSWARNQVSPGNLYSYRDKSDRQARLSVNGKDVSATPDKSGYVTLDRTWKNGDVIAIEFPIETRKVVAHPNVKDNRGRIAIERGPIVYTSEWPDCPDGKVLELLFDPAAEPTVRTDAGLFGGVPVLHTSARRVTNPSAAAQPVKLIPYYLWANRGAGEMNLWLSVDEYALGDVGPAGGFIFYINPNYAKDGWRYLEAAPFDQSAGATWGCFRKLIPGARGTAIGTGKQNTADMLAGCDEPVSAAPLCAHLSLNGVRGWFLPSRDELTEMYKHLAAKGIGNFTPQGVVDNFMYWASSQQTADMAAHTDFVDNGRLHGDDKDFPRRVRAARMI